MSEVRFPRLEAGAFGVTRDALHAYSKVLGGWLKMARPYRKHWWHSSLCLSLTGLTTGIVRGGRDFEIELCFVTSQLRTKTLGGDHVLALDGQSAADLAGWIDDALVECGVDSSLGPGEGVRSDTTFPGYSPAQAQKLHGALSSVAAALEQLRAGIREETSPIQMWPHHFDLSMIWLPGGKIAGQDPADEESADKQMNFGFVFGDSEIAEPYLYITAYPAVDAIGKTALPDGATWHSQGFSGAVVRYESLIAMPDAADYLQDLWARLLAAGRNHLATDD